MTIIVLTFGRMKEVVSVEGAEGLRFGARDCLDRYVQLEIVGLLKSEASYDPLEEGLFEMRDAVCSWDEDCETVRIV
jgi:hypothetical protein